MTYQAEIARVIQRDIKENPDADPPHPGPNDLLSLRGWGMPARPLLRGFSRRYVRARARTRLS
jgi:hypothetical protein